MNQTVAADDTSTALHGYKGGDILDHYRQLRRGQLHPDAARLAERFRQNGVQTYDVLGVAEARELLEGVTRLQKPPVAIDRVEDGAITTPQGRIGFRAYHPDPSQQLPMVVYIHGGGWTLGSIAAADRPCRRLSQAGNCVVVSLDYSLAPEHKFPTALQECVSALCWLLDHGHELGGDSTRLAVLGDSAGGNLAAAVVQSLVAQGENRVAALLLLYPCLFPARASPFASYREHANGPLMTAGEMTWFWDNYLASDSDGNNPSAAPLLAKHFDGMPPTTVVVAEFDVLCDEGLTYAQQLRRAGVSTDAIFFAGAPHGFWWMDGALAQAEELDALLGEKLHALFPNG